MKITIQGERQAGASTLAALLQRLLPKYGYDVTFEQSYGAEKKVNEQKLKEIDDATINFDKGRKVFIYTAGY